MLVDTNEASFEFHKRLGFSEVGHFENAGFKLGAWRGIRWMVKQIGASEGEPQKPLKLSEVTKTTEMIDDCGLTIKNIGGII